MKYSWLMTTATYQINLPAEVFRAIMRHDDDGYEPLCDSIMALPGVVEVNYDGHFGPHIWVTLELDFDLASLQQQIEDLIDELSD